MDCFEKIIGNEEVLGRLALLLKEKRLNHGVLYAGPKGVGKYLAARSTAACYLRNLARQGGASVRGSLEENHPDLHLLQPLEGRRDILIDQVRELSDSLALKPFEALGKAAVIDDADRMNVESQNAFLKTLEEPPESTLIILVSSNLNRLLPTVRSRCRRFRFKGLSEKEMELFITQSEKGGGQIPLSLAEGSPGRLLKLMEMNALQVRSLLIQFLSSSKLPSPVKAASDVMSWAKTSKITQPVLRDRLRFAFHLAAGLLRDLLALKNGAGKEQLLHSDLAGELGQAAGYYTVQGIYYALDGLMEGDADIAEYVDPGLSLEQFFRILRDARN